MSTSATQRRQLDFRSWPEVFADIDQLHRTGYVRAGNWDLSQILEHVGDGLKTAVEGNKNQGPWIVRKLIGPFLFRRMLRTRKMKAGIKVPDWWLPGPSHDESASVDQFRSTVSAFQKMPGPAQPHPFLGNLSKADWNELGLIHAAHHLSFLKSKGQNN